MAGNTSKKRKGRRVTADQVLRCLYKWLKIYGWNLDDLKTHLEELEQLVNSLDERLTRIEAFLGGIESMDEVLKDTNLNTYKPEQRKEGKGEKSANS